MLGPHHILLQSDVTFTWFVVRLSEILRLKDIRRISLAYPYKMASKPWTDIEHWEKPDATRYIAIEGEDSEDVSLWHGRTNIKTAPPGYYRSQPRYCSIKEVCFVQRRKPGVTRRPCNYGASLSVNRIKIVTSWPRAFRNSVFATKKWPLFSSLKQTSNRNLSSKVRIV